MIRPTTVVTLLLAALLAGVPPAALASRAEGVRFAEAHEVAGHRLVLSCTALLRYLVFIRAFVAGLYLAEGVAPGAVLTDVPKRLEIEYFHAIRAADFVRATEYGLAQNVDPATLAALRPRIDQLNALYEDVRPGDRYALTYVPGLGTELALNGVPRGRIPGADFAAAVFSIWLGPNPIDTALKRDLLECAA